MSATTIPNRRLKMGLVVGLAFIVGIFVFLGTFAVVRHFVPASHRGLVPIAERSAGALKLPTLAGGDAGPRWSLSDHTGEVVVVNYFATWCPPCVEEMPDLRTIAAEFTGKGVAFAGVSFDQDAQVGKPFLPVLQGFVQREGLTYPILVPPRDSTMFAEETPLPQTFLIDKHGRTAVTILGPIDGAELRGYLKQLLAEE